MTSRSDSPQVKYAVYRMTTRESGSGLEYNIAAGPFTERKQAVRKAEELNQSEPEIYFAYIVTEYKGKSWSPERSGSFSWEADSSDRE